MNSNIFRIPLQERLASYLVLSALTLSGCNNQLFSNNEGSSSASLLPNAPLEVVALSGSSVVSLSWKPIQDANPVTYSVRRSSVLGSNYAEITSGLVNTTFIDSTVSNGETYYYIITATDANGSNNSQPVQAHPQQVSLQFAPTLASAYINSSNQKSFQVQGTCGPVGSSVQLSGIIASSIRCNADGTFSKTFDFSNLSDSLVGYTIYGDISDPFGNLASQASIVLKKNTLTPSISITSPSTQTLIDLSVYSSFTVSGNCSVNGNLISISATDGKLIATPSQSVYCDTAATPNFTAVLDVNSLGTAIQLQATLTDLAGNSASSPSIALSKIILINSPSSGAIINKVSNSSTYPISGYCIASGATITIRVNEESAPGEALATCSNHQFQTSIDTTGLEEGTYALSAIMSDSNNNQYTSSENLVTKDTIPPTLTLTYPTLLSLINQANQTHFSASGVCSVNGQNVSVQATDGSNLVLSPNSAICTKNGFSTHLSLASLQDGSLTFTAIQQDSAGNFGTSDPITVSKHAQGPGLMILVPSSGSTIDNSNNSAYFTISGTCNQAAQAITLLMDQTVFSRGAPPICDGSTFSGTVDTTSLADGNHTFGASISDSYQNQTTMNVSLTKSIGAFQLALSLPSQFTAGTSSLVTISAKDNDGNIAINYTGQVIFSSSDSKAQMPYKYTFSSADRGVHVFSTLIFRTAGTQSLTVSDSRHSNLTATQSSLRVNPGAASLSKSSLVMSTTSNIPADGNSNLNFTITLIDANGNALSNVIPILSSSGSGNVFTQPGATNSQGIAVASLRSTVAETKQIYISSPTGLSPLAVASTFISVLPDSNQSSISANTASIPADNSTTATLTITLKNNNGYPLVGKSVNLVSSRSSFGDQIAPNTAITDSSGHALFTLKSTSAGVSVLTATELSSLISINSFSFPITSGKASRILLSGFSSETTAGSANSVTVSAYDAFGNIASTYTGSVAFNSSDYKATLPSNYTFTNADAGSHVFNLAVYLKTAGTQNLSVTDISSTGLTSSLSSIQVIPNSASAAQTQIGANPGSKIFADGSSQSTITLILKDAYGNIISGITPTLTCTGTGNSFTQPSATDSSGMTTATLSSTVSEVKTISLSYPENLTNVKAVVIFGSTLGDSGYSSISSNVSSLLADGSSVASISVILKNNVGDALANKSISLNAGRVGKDIISPTIAITNSSGLATFTVKSNYVGYSTFSATDVSDQLILFPSTASVLFIAGPANQLVFSGIPDSFMAGISTTLTMSALDAYGNLATTDSNSLQITSSDSQAILPSRLALSNGTQSFTIQFNTVGIVSITASSSNLSVTQSDIPVNSAPASVLTLSGIPTSMVAGTPSDISVVARDNQGNLATTFTGTLTFISNDTQAEMNPRTYTFTTADQGIHVFPAGITLKTAGNSRTLSAKSGTLSVTGQNSINVFPADASAALSTLSAAYSSPLLADGTAKATLTVHLQDNYGNPITNISPAVSASGSNNTFIPSAFAATNQFGNTSAVLTSTSSGAKVIALTYPSSVNSVSTTITFGSNSVDPNLSTLSISPASAVGDGNHSVDLTVTFKNSDGMILKNKTVSLTSSRGNLDTLSSSTETTDNDGQAQFSISSSTLGLAILSIEGIDEQITLSQLGYANFVSETPQIDYQARLFDSSQAGSPSAPKNTLWTNLMSPAAVSGELFHFLMASSSGWSGDGTSLSPYALQFDSSLENYVIFGSSSGYPNNESNFSFETWVLPSTSITAKSVILSNGDESNHGVQLKQEGSGYVELSLGNSSSYSAQVFENQPVAYYRLSDTSSSILDFSGNNLTATASGSYTQGVSGALLNDGDTGIELNGTNGVIALPNSTVTSRTTLSIETWFKTNQGGVIFGYQSNPLTASANTGNHVPVLYIGQSNYKLRGQFWTGVVNPITSSVSVADGNWHHVVLSTNGSTQSLYLDGSLVGSLSGTVSHSSMVYNQIGTGDPSTWLDASVGWSYFNGMIDEFVVYNSALSAAQVLKHYQSRVIPSCLSSSILTNQAYSLLAGVFDNSSSTLSLYINGSPVCTSSVTGMTYSGSSQALSAGAAFSNSSPLSGTYFSGKMGELRTYNSALSSTEILNDYNALKPIYQTSP